uniref:HD domain-containing protein n=1 Tax=Caldiarchaeum subterraneum TaxID=311458 RepID=A0A7C5U7V3_CALS0
MRGKLIDRTLSLYVGVKLIKDPVHGYITFTDEEIRLVDSRPVQRLRRINQLPLVYLIYPGARHSRFDHSIGCIHLAGEFAEHLNLSPHEKTLLKTAALLHDVGHTPFSHLFEELLLSEGLSHEDMSIRVIENDDEISNGLNGLGVEANEVVSVLKGETRLSGLVSGPLDVDRLDFLVRDAYFSGATYGIIDVHRIVRLTKLLDDGPAVDSRGIGAVEELALARYHSFINIYFHHAVRAAQIMLLRAAQLVRNKLDFARMSLEEYLDHDDFTVWCLLRGDERARKFVERLERRILPKRIYEKQVLGGTGQFFNLETRVSAERKIAEEAGVDSSKVYLDFSYGPPLTKYGPQQIRLDPQPSSQSWIIDQLTKPLDIVRVYVDRDVKEADRVKQVAGDVISSILE